MLASVPDGRGFSLSFNVNVTKIDGTASASYVPTGVVYGQCGSYISFQDEIKPSESGNYDTYSLTFRWMMEEK